MNRKTTTGAVRARKSRGAELPSLPMPPIKSVGPVMGEPSEGLIARGLPPIDQLRADLLSWLDRQSVDLGRLKKLEPAELFRRVLGMIDRGELGKGKSARTAKFTILAALANIEHGGSPNASNASSSGASAQEQAEKVKKILQRVSSPPYTTPALDAPVQPDREREDEGTVKSPSIKEKAKRSAKLTTERLAKPVPEYRAKKTGYSVYVDPEIAEKFKAIVAAKDLGVQEALERFINETVEKNPHLIEPGRQKLQGPRRYRSRAAEKLEQENRHLAELLRTHGIKAG